MYRIRATNRALHDSQRLTAAGRKLVASVLVAHEQQIETVLGGLPAADQAHLHRLLARLGRHLESLANTGPFAIRR